MFRFQSVPISLLSYAIPRTATKLRLSNNLHDRFRGGGARLRASESRRMTALQHHRHKQHGVTTIAVDSGGGRKYMPLEQNLKGKYGGE